VRRFINKTGLIVGQSYLKIVARIFIFVEEFKGDWETGRLSEGETGRARD